MGVIRWLKRLAVLGALGFGATAAAMLYTAGQMQDRYGGDRGIPEPVDVAIVLGGGTKPDLILDFTTRQRVRMGVFHLQEGNTGMLIMTGGPMKGLDLTAAAAMRDFAVELGAPAEKILLEERSRTTLENLRFAFQIMDEQGFETFAIVSDDYHLARARELARVLGREPSGLGASHGMYFEPRPMQIAITLRETMAWGYNLYKAAAWWTLGVIGYSETERAERVF
ncbi:MAG: YdcF family protein [Pseudomonadota bacterium]